MFILPASRAIENAQRTNLDFLAPLRPYIFGSKALLHRYDVAGEKSTINVGTYNYSIDQTFSWPNKESTSIVDTTYTKVYLDNAYLNYYNNLVGTGDSVVPVASYTNRIKVTGINLKTTTNYSRNSVFLDRDVAVGDIVYIRGTVGSDTYEQWTEVSDLLPDAGSASVASATADSANKTTQSLSTSISQVSGTPVNDITATVTGSGYSSLDDGYISRTYTVTVTQGSTGSDATTAKLSVVSADGLDNQSSVTPAAFGAATSIGTKGLTVTFDTLGDASSISAASASGLLPDDLIVGQQWTVTVNQDYTTVVATSGGTYTTGPSTTTYIVRISKGGLTTDTTKPQITVSTTTGVDSSSPTDVTAASTAISVGNYGVTISFAQTKLRKGDIFYITATAAADGPVRTIVLKNDLNTNLTSATDLDLGLYIKQSGLLMAETRSVPSAGYNYTQSQTGITVKSAFQAYDSTWTDGGVQQPLHVTNGDIYVHYREWSIVDGNKLIEISKTDDVATTLGVVHPDNPIAWGVQKALENTAGAVLSNPSAAAATTTDVVKCAYLAGDPTDSTSWSDVLGVVAYLEDIYTLVPLTQDATIQALVASHVTSQSTVLESFYRCCLLSPAIPTANVVVNNTTSSDSEVVLAKLIQNPTVVSTSYSYIQVTSGNSKFLTNGVKAGDKVRFEYTLDSFGAVSYTEYTVSSVVSEDSLVVTTGGSQAVTIPQRVEVWRNYTSADTVTALKAKALSYASTRIIVVYPDTVINEGISQPGYYACAALAGQIGSIPSQQGLRNVQLLGFDDVTFTKNYFTSEQRTELSSNGVWLIEEDIASSNVYSRWPTTTSFTTVNDREEMVRRNADMFVFALLQEWEEYIGNANINEAVIDLLKAKFDNLVGKIKAQTIIEKIGSAIIDATLNSLTADTTLTDNLIADFTVTGPKPNNKIQMKVTIA